MTAARQPRGISAGGQFAATAHAEPEGAQLVGVRIGEPRPMTREELVITGQAVDGNPALSEATRMVHYNRRQLAQAIKAMDETMLNAVVVHARQAFPGVKELRMRERTLGDGKGQITATFIRHRRR